MRSLLLDLHCALRALRKTPLFTGMAVGTLCLGIAFNLIIFTVVDAMLLRPLPYPAGDKIVVLQSKRPHLPPEDLTAPMFARLQKQGTALQDIAALYPTEAGVNLSESGTTFYARALRVSADFFHTLRRTPAEGRTFNQSEDQPGGPHVAILSYPLWKRLSSGGQL